MFSLSWQSVWGFRAQWESCMAYMDILKSSVGILEERKNAFGLNMIAFMLMETKNIALGGIWSGHQKSTSLFVRSLGCFGRLKWCGKSHWHYSCSVAIRDDETSFCMSLLLRNGRRLSGGTWPCCFSLTCLCISLSSYLECSIKNSQGHYGHCCPWCSHYNHKVDLQQVEQESQQGLQLVRDDRINSIHFSGEAVQQVSNRCLLKEDHWGSSNVPQQLQKQLVWC